MGIDLILLQASKGGDPAIVKESQRKRNADPELVDRVVALYEAWTTAGFNLNQKQKEVNGIQKEIGAKKKAKENADDLIAKKGEADKEIADLKSKETEAEATLKKVANNIGNIVHPSVPVSTTEDDNVQVKTWHPQGPNAQVKKEEGIISHHEVMYRLGLIDQERGTKVAGHRGYFLTDYGVDLNQALISYGLQFLRTRGYKKVMTPFMMKRTQMSKTAQLDEFDEALYKVEGAEGEEEKYLIATSEQPISAFHSDEWFENPKEQLPIKYAGFSTCFRKEAGAHGKDTWGIFRVHQFEKIEQFCITDPASSYEMFDQMLAASEEFYQSLGLPYQIVDIVSGALNNAAAKKCDLEAWFPYQGEYKELVSVSNCTDYQARGLEVRCGVKKKGDTTKKYCHMLNGTLCATERALCCLVENYQTPEGLNIPEPLIPYMHGIKFLPYIKELPKGSTSTKKDKN